MATQKKNYTNGDIIKRLDAMDARLGAVEIWKISQDAGKAAVDEYRRQESSNKAEQGRDSLYAIMRDAGPWILIILAGLAAIIYAYAQRPHQ